MHIALYLDPQRQSVIERFSLLGEFVTRGSTVYVCMYVCMWRIANCVFVC